MAWRVRKGSTVGFTLIELLVVIAIIGILAALLLPTLTAVRCRSKEGAAQAQIRDMESAIKAYESDYASFPRPDMATFMNQNLVFMLGRPGSRGTPYYSFRRDQQGTTAGVHTSPGSYVDELALIPATPMTAYPCFYSPVTAWGGTSSQDIYQYFYDEHKSEPTPKPVPTFNPFSYDMWTGGCVTLSATGNIINDYGGDSAAGRGVSQINNWR